MAHLSRLTLRLARNPGSGFPEGDSNRGYVIVAPLNTDHFLDIDLWRQNRAKCIVTRFSPVDEERADGVLTHRGGQWRIAYDEDKEGPDEAGWQLASHRLEIGAYVTITSGEGVPLVYRITEALEL